MKWQTTTVYLEDLTAYSNHAQKNLASARGTETHQRDKNAALVDKMLPL